MAVDAASLPWVERLAKVVLTLRAFALLVTVLAADAIGAERVHTVAMPSRYSSDHSETDAEKQNIEVVQAICALLDQRRPREDGQPRSSQITHVTDRPGHDRRYAIDAGKLKSELGWAPQHSFEQGIADTVDWYLDNQPWVQRVLDGSYRLERIGQAA